MNLCSVFISGPVGGTLLSPIKTSLWLVVSLGLVIERVKGVEPSSGPWKGPIIAVIRHPHNLYNF